MQATLTAYLIGESWCLAHNRAVAYIVQRATVDNAKGRKARLQQYIEEMRCDPLAFDLTAEKNGRYGFNHSLRTEVARYIQEQYGVEFALRQSKSDPHGVPNATPVIAHS